MKIRTLLSGIFLIWGLAAFGQERDFKGATTQFEPVRARLVPTAKRDSVDSYCRELNWKPAADSEGAFVTRGSVPFAWNNRQVLLRIASAPAGYTLQIGGRKVGESSTGALPMEFNLTKYLTPGQSFTLELTPYGANHPHRQLEDFRQADSLGLTELISQPTIRVRELFTRTRRTEGGYLGEVGVVVKCDALNEKSARIRYELIDTAGVVVKQGFSDVRLRMRGEDTLRFVYAVPQHLLWSPDSPLHYRLRLSTQTLGRYTEYLNLPVAFRQVELVEGVLHINGKPLAMQPHRVDKPLTKEELQQIKAEGCQLLLPLPGCSTEELYELADQVGLCVVAQSPLCTEKSGTARTRNGNPTNDPTRVSEYLVRTQSAYFLTQRHPSVVALNLAHKSANGIALYESYLALKRIAHGLPIVYTDAAGEWNDDKLGIRN